MSNLITIGTLEDQFIHSLAAFDLDVLRTSHLLIQAASGAGKSYAMRVIAEQLFGIVPIFLFDPEDEYASLREKYGFVLVGEGGDIPIHIKTAAVTAQRLMKMNVSAIFNLYGLEVAEQHEWMRVFNHELMNLPRALWHPLAYMLDESHLFCLDTETELLTKHGWRKFDQIAVGDIAICFDLQNSVYCEGSISRLIVKNHSGPMVSMKSDGIDCLATEDHRVVMRRTQRAKGRYKKYPWEFEYARSVPCHADIPCGGGPDFDDIPNLSLDMLEILGWVITDGHFTGGNSKRYLNIEQSIKTNKGGVNMVASLTKLLSRLNGQSIYNRPERIHNSFGKLIRSRATKSFYLGVELSAQLLYWLGDDIHRIPRRILAEASKVQLAALYRGLLHGDGTTNKNGWCAFYPGDYEPLADDFQELCVRLGISTTKKLVPQTGQWTVSITRRKSHYIRKKSSEFYSGLVWDITVPTGAFIARRRGKVFVTGNCPEGGEGHSVAAQDIKNVACRGRKRGIFNIWATQRLAKLDKTAASELQNAMVGRTFLHNDRETAAKILGVPKGASVRDQFYNDLKVLKRGQFFAQGVAIAVDRILFSVKQAHTHHPEPGSPKDISFPTPSQIRSLLPELSEISAEAEKKEKTEVDLRAQIAKLTASLAEAQSKPAGGISEEVFSTVVSKAIEDARRPLLKVIEHQRKGLDQIGEIIGPLRNAETFAECIKPSPQPEYLAIKTPPKVNGRTFTDVLGSQDFSKPKKSAPEISVNPRPPGGPSKIETAIMTALATHPQGRTRRQIAVLTGYAINGGSFRGAIGAMKNAGFIREEGNSVSLTQDGAKALGSYTPLPKGRDLLNHWIGQLDKTEADILRAVTSAWPHEISRVSVAEITGREITGGSFRGAIGRLKTLELITGREDLKASDAFFE